MLHKCVRRDLTVCFSSTDWVDVANDLLSKCHISLRLRKLADSNADVFIALYENILGEKVPGKKNSSVVLHQLR